MRVITGIDLPLDPNCGSMILCDDVYDVANRMFDVEFVALESSVGWQPRWSRTHVFQGSKSAVGTSAFPTYVADLTRRIDEIVDLHGLPDVVHAQHLGYGMSLALARNRSLSGVPFVSIAHGTDIIDARADSPATDVMWEIVDRSDLVVVPSDRVAADIDDLVGHAAGAYEVVPWGVPVSELTQLREVHREPHHEPRDGLRVVYAGRLDANKDVATLLRAMALLPHTVWLEIIGSGPTKVELGAQADEAGMAGRVVFTEFMPRRRLWQKLCNFDVLVLPTRDYEAFGLVAFEAQALGIPVLAASTTSLQSDIAGGGLTFPPGDAAALAALLEAIGQGGRAYRALAASAGANSARFDVRRTAGGLLSASFRAQTGATR